MRSGYGMSRDAKRYYGGYPRRCLRECRRRWGQGSSRRSFPRQFFDATGKLWVAGALVGKPGSVFTSSATQHGGQESTILSVHTTLLHHGMVIVGLPYTFEGQSRLDEITGGSPYGASTIAGNGPGTRWPSENELAAARYQGRHVAEIAKKLAG